MQVDLLHYFTFFTVDVLDMNFMLKEEWRCINWAINHAQIFVSFTFPQVVVYTLIFLLLLLYKIKLDLFNTWEFRLYKRWRRVACAPLENWCHRKEQGILELFLLARIMLTAAEEFIWTTPRCATCFFYEKEWFRILLWVAIATVEHKDWEINKVNKKESKYRPKLIYG